MKKRKKKPSCETNPFKETRPLYNERKYIRWVDPFDSIHKGKLGSSQTWRDNKSTKEYY